MKPEIRIGQTWEKVQGDAPSSPPTRIRVLGTPFGGRVVVGTVRSDGTTFRVRSVLCSALSNTPSGYMLVKDVDATPEAKAKPMPESNMAKEMGMAIAQRITQSAKFHAALMTRDCEVNAEPTTPDALHIAQCQKCEVAYPADVPHSCSPSPLDVVQREVRRWVPEPNLTGTLSAIATLEESIRADEREKALHSIHPGVVELVNDYRHKGHRFRWDVKCLTCMGKS